MLIEPFHSPGKFLGLQRTAFITFAAYEACLRIHETLKIELLTPIIDGTADYIHRIEVGRAFEHGHSSRIVHVQLGPF